MNDLLPPGPTPSLPTDHLPAATRRCWDCGVGSGPCQCTREFLKYEEAEEQRQDDEWAWLEYVDELEGAGVGGAAE